MQLGRKPKKVHGKVFASLAAASCSLLGAASTHSVAAEEAKSWKFDTALLYYGESDRVQDASASLMASRLFPGARLLTLNLTVDTLTGSSASGATPARGPQTFTQPSGKAQYTIPAGQTPLDPTFLDTRIALAVNWSQPLGRLTRADFGVSLSDEYDYFHAGVNARFSRDFHNRNTTLNFGVAFGSDSLDPEGGAPVPLSPLLPIGDLSNKMGTESKTVADVLIGVTRVLGRRSIGQVNYSFSQSSGYQTDPYKLVSVVDPVTGDPAPGPGGLDLYLSESRPDSRTKHSLFGQWKYKLGRDIIDLSYRFMTDDWGIQSNTLDLRYRWMLRDAYIQPHLRYYTQTAADFYATFLVDGDPLPEHAAADYRLGDLDGITIGLKYGRPFGDGKEWSLRAEYYSQSGRGPPGIGSLVGLDLYPTVDAIIAQVGYRF